MNATLGFIRSEVEGSCSNGAIKERLADYLVDPLDEKLAEVVEEHLLDCRTCRELVLLMLEARQELTQGRPGHEPDANRVLNFLQFRRDGL